METEMVIKANVDADGARSPRRALQKRGEHMSLLPEQMRERGAPKFGNRSQPMAVLWAVLMAVSALVACGDAGEEHDIGADASIPSQEGACSRRKDCDALGGRWMGMACGAQGRCEPCSSDGQCGIRERCDRDRARCVFRDGFGDECELNGQCPGGSFCSQGLCRDALSVTFCVQGGCLADGQRCNGVNGVCEADLGCLDDDDCGTGELCNVPTGSCVRRCIPDEVPGTCGAGERCLVDRCSGCAEDGDCGAGMTCDRERLSCVGAGGLERCTRTTGCGRDEVCDIALGVCLPARRPCFSDEECPGTDRCNVALGRCQEGACVPDRFEPNGSMEEAVAAGRYLVAGTYDGLSLCGGEDDFHAVSLERGTGVSATLNADVLLESRLHMALLDPMGRTLGTGRLSVSGTAVMDGVHVLRIWSDEDWVDYGLSLATYGSVPCDFDALEPNDSREQASLLEDVTALAGLTLCGEDEDWFSVPLPSGACGASLAPEIVSGRGAILVEPAGTSDCGGRTGSDLVPEDTGRCAFFRIRPALAGGMETYGLKVSYLEVCDE